MPTVKVLVEVKGAEQRERWSVLITDIPTAFQICALSDIPSPWAELKYGHTEKFNKSFKAEASCINLPHVFSNSAPAQ